MAEYIETKTQEVSHPTVVKTVKHVEPTQAVRTEHPQKVFEKKKVIFRTYQVVWYVLVVIEVILGFRMTLKALGANPASGFTSFVYGLSDPLALPFSGILRTNVVQGSVFEWSTLIAAIVYFLIALGIVQFIQLVKPVSPHEVEETVDNA